MKKKILVVDDEEFHRDLLNKLLTKSGYEVAEAESPEVALAIMKNEDFPVIITDHRLNRVCGSLRPGKA